MEKKFILGIGCQKGGTTWLYSQLQQSKNVDLGFKKEYHVLDSLYAPAFKGKLRRKLQLLYEKGPEFDNFSSMGDQLKLLSFCADPENYYDYFDHLWYKGGSDVTAVGDITPTYAALEPDILDKIKTQLEQRGFQVKIVFLMRDPIERCWSQLRMNRRFQLDKDPSIHLPNEYKQLENKFSSKGFELRTTYEKTIQNYESVFPAEDIFYTQYELLFQAETLLKLKNFLEIDDFEPDVNYKVCVSKKTKQLQNLDDQLAQKIFNHYRETYLFCQQRFNIKEIWSGWKYADS